MEKFAFLDDSLQIYKGFYVYSHALVFSEENIETLVLNGSKNYVYNQENEIYLFLIENLEFDTKLIACKHYEQYKNLSNDLVFSYYQLLDKEIYNGNKKYFTKLFSCAHSVAKKTAKDFLNF
jgi:hypothetical protein